MKVFRKVICWLTLITTSVYLFFRVFFTLPSISDSSIIFSIAVLILEIVDFVFFAVYVFSVLLKKRKVYRPPRILKKDYPELDIFIATVNEDSSLIIDTIKACRGMKYPAKSKLHFYLCDDGNRAEMRRLAKEHNIGYFSRKDNNAAKAGNYNNALQKTSSPFIVVFDADMRPTPDFLMRSVPYLFMDEKIGFIQLPQSFSNLDIFQRKFKLGKYIPSEQDYFYHRIQTARNYHNSAIFCGTNAIISRSALVDIGGFATESISEDFATGLLIEAHGFRGIALPFDEAYGTNVRNITSLIKQRSRWCRGCIQTYKNYQIITNNGLSASQKADYLSGIYYWLFGFRNILYLLIPLLYCFWGVRIIQGDLVLFCVFFLIQYALKRFAIDLLESREVSATWNRIYEIVLSPAILVASLLEIFGLSKKKFEVTNKQKDQRESYMFYLLVVCHIMLLALNITGLFTSIAKGIEGQFTEWIIPIFWLATNSIFLLFAAFFDLSRDSEFIAKDLKEPKRYDLKAPLIAMIKFITEEVKIKRIAIVGGLLFVINIGIIFFQNLQITQPVILKKEALVSYNQWLSVDNGKIVNQNNQVIQLRGISSHNLYYFGDYYTEANLREIVNTWGINVFRIALYTDPGEEGYIAHKNILERVENIIDTCIKLDIYVIIDWHILKDNNPNKYKAEAIEFFDTISKKYSKYPNVIYEICNEPNGDVSWDKDIKPYAEEVTKIIRDNTSKSLIIVGLANWSRDIKAAMNNLLLDPNTIYSVHFYAGFSGSDVIRTDMEEAIRKRIPLIVTECGATDATGDGELYKDEFNDWVKFLEGHKIGWIFWQLSEKDEASSLVISRDVQDRLDLISEKYTEEELRRKKYYVNDYLSDTGKYVKEIFVQYN